LRRSYAKDERPWRGGTPISAKITIDWLQHRG
jgi:hypothetical protein